MIEQQEEGNVVRGKRVIRWKTMDQTEKNLCIHTIILKEPTWCQNVEHFSSGTLYCPSCRVFLTNLGGHAVPIPNYLTLDAAFHTVRTLLETKVLSNWDLADELWVYRHTDPIDLVEDIITEWTPDRLWVATLKALGDEVEV